MATSAEILDRLYATLAARRGGDAEQSYTARLLARGTERIAQKLGEEAVEAVVAAIKRDRGALIGESADLVYHLLVLLIDAGIRPEEVWAELERREGTSGLAEKASRRS